MQKLSGARLGEIKYLFSDIDDTLTNDGRLGPQAYHSLWRLFDGGIQVIPVTGRPAGWCEMIARQWPVAAVVGENGAFYFRYHNQTMKRHFEQSEQQRIKNQIKLEEIKTDILEMFPEVQVASDQFCRLFDLAIDFAEDVQTSDSELPERIVKVFESYGAQAKISSIHVNGWFGSHSKLTMCLKLLNLEFGLDPMNETTLNQCAFVGDSPNDEPMFKHFPLSFGVANVRAFLPKMKHHPKFIADAVGGLGFEQIVNHLLSTLDQQR